MGNSEYMGSCKISKYRGIPIFEILLS